MKRDSVMAWAAFFSQFAWYHIVFYNYINSPLPVLAARATSADPQMLLILLFASIGLTQILSFLIIKDKDMYTNRPFWFLVHIAMLACAVAIPLATSLWLLYLFVVLCGMASGMIFFRNLYSSFFNAPKTGWLRIVICFLFFFNIFIHLFALVPSESNPELMYAVSVILLCFSTIMGLSYRNNTLEIRKSLPENKLTLKMTIPVMALFAGITICFAAYKSVVLSTMPETPEIAWHQAIACFVSIALFFALGNRLKQGVYPKILLALLTAAFISIQILAADGHKLAETFVQPAYLCWNIILFSYLRSLFYQYGKNHLRIRIIIVLFLISIALPEVISRWLLGGFLAESLQPLALFYAIVFGLVLLIPQIDRAIAAAYQEIPGADAGLIAVSDAAIPENTDSAFARISALLPAVEHLTERETSVLKLLLEWQDVDVIAYMLAISQNTVRTHIKHICEKFDVRSKAELVSLAGIVSANKDISSREVEVLRGIASGLDNAEIAEELFISINTVRSHIHNLYRKCGVSSRRELARLYAEICQMQIYLPTEKEQAKLPHQS